jgi:hypothetical protein
MPSLYERVLISIGQTFLEEPKKTRKKIHPAILYVIDVDHPEMTVAVSCNMHVRITKYIGNLITGRTRYRRFSCNFCLFIVEADSELLLTRKLLNQGFLVIKFK